MSQITFPVHPEIKFEDLVILNKVSSGKFEVFLASNQSQSEFYAIKMIPHYKGSLNPYYLREMEFSRLSHPNILTARHGFNSINITSTCENYSLIVSEYAPNLDLYSLMVERGVKFDEKLSRTFFKQLVCGVEYLHANSTAHLDLKLENIVLDKNFNLRIIDFDLAEKVDESKEFYDGCTMNYRSLELMNGNCTDPFKADMYSIGVILFVFLAKGLLPYKENEVIGDIDLQQAFLFDKKTFWDFHKLINREVVWTQEIKGLIEGLCEPDPEMRFDLEAVKNHPWFMKETYSDSEVSKIMEELLSSEDE